MRFVFLRSTLLLGSVLLGACQSQPPETGAVSTEPSSSPQASIKEVSSEPTPLKPTVNCEQLAKGTFEVKDQFELDLWPWDKAAAWSFTVDEGVPEPYDLLVPELELYGWRASFFIYTQQPDARTWSRIRNAHQRGHEVSNHTLTHPDLTTLSDEKIHQEIKLANDELKHQLGEVSLQSFAYPFEATDDRTWSIVKQYHRYARSGDHGAAVPPYPINDAHKPNWGALTAKAPTLEYSLADWNTWVDAAVEARGWFIDELHGVENDGVIGGWEPRTLEEFRGHFDYIKNHPKGVWVATMGEVGNYIEERENARFSIQAWDNKGALFTLEDGFDHPLDYQVPLTFLMRLPEGMSPDQIKAYQDESLLELQKVDARTVRVQALPDAQKPVCVLPN